MKKGYDMMDMIGKVLLFIVFGLFIISFFIPKGQTVIFIAFGLFFLFPLSQELLYYFYKFFYRNIEIVEGFLDEEADTWEKIKWRVIKVIPLDLLPKVLHDKYLGMVDTNYQNLLRDKSIDELNRFLLINKEGEIPDGNEKILINKEGEIPDGNEK